METIDGLRVSCFLSGHVTVAPARSVPPNTEVVPPAQKTCSPLSFLFFLFFSSSSSTHYIQDGLRKALRSACMFIFDPLLSFNV